MHYKADFTGGEIDYHAPASEEEEESARAGCADINDESCVETVQNGAPIAAFSGLSRKTRTLWYLGMPAFEPQDVSGWDLDTVWTVDRMTQTHMFLDQIMKATLWKRDIRTNANAFNSRTAFESHYAGFQY